MIDIHSHILSNIDDGAKDMEESLAIAKLAIDEGYSKVIASPHFFGDNSIEIFIENIKFSKEKIDSLLKDNNISLEIMLGAEIFIDLEILEDENLNLLALNNTRYMLTELPAREVPRFAEDFYYTLKIKGYHPIIAHPERNISLIEDPNKLIRFVELGCLTQINTGSITGLFGKEVQKTARILLEHNMAHFLATDTHSNRRRGPYIKEAEKIVQSWIGEEKASKIINKNPETLLYGDDSGFDEILNEEPIVYKKRWSFFDVFR